MDTIRKISNIIINHKEERKEGEEKIGLLNGKMGTCLFLFHSYKATGNILYKEHTEALLNDIYKNITPSSPTFESGLAGIGWGIEYLINNEFCKGNSNDILREIDSCIFRLHQEKEKITLNLTTGLGGYLLYIIKRIENNKKYERNSIRKEQALINQDLFRQIIDRINTEAASAFFFLNKDLYIDFFNVFPHIIYIMRKALSLNLYNEKILCILKQWAFNFEVSSPRLHIHRLLLAISLKEANDSLEVPIFNQVINNLLSSINYEILSTEYNPYSFSLIDGWHGFVFTLKKASITFDKNIPNYESLDKIRYKTIQIHKTAFENYIDKLQDPSKDMTMPRLGIKSGLAGAGLLYLFFPDAFV